MTRGTGPDALTEGREEDKAPEETEGGVKEGEAKMVELVLGVVLLCLGVSGEVVAEWEEAGDHLPREEGIRLRLRNREVQV